MLSHPTIIPFIWAICGSTPMVAFSWSGAALAPKSLNAGPLALVQPLLEKLDLSNILDRFLPHDSQREFTHGQVLTALVAARLCHPTALVNVQHWADDTGYEFLGGVPAEKLNDDRLARALDPFFASPHSALAAVTVQALEVTGLSLQRLHFDPTTLCVTGSYNTSQPRPDWPNEQPLRGDAAMLPAPLCHNYSTDGKAIQLAQVAIIDELGAVPVFAHVLDGNRNGHPAIHQTFDLLRDHLNLPPHTRLISDRGTFSVAHLARLYRNDYKILCAANWEDFRAVYEAHANQLQWSTASCLSVEQKRRRREHSGLPLEHYDLAVLGHEVVDPDTKHKIPVRLIFTMSSAGQREARERRQQQIDKIQAGLKALQGKILRGHPRCTPQTISQQVVRLLGKKEAARYFTWQLVALTVEEQAALPTPGTGHLRATHRLEFTCDAAAALAAQRYDGLAVLVTTVGRQQSADQLFTEYKEQNYLETLHHQNKTPLAVCPIFLKTPQRVEALVCLLQLCLQAYQVLERLYRQRTPADAPVGEKRMTAERLLRSFQSYGLVIRPIRLGQVVQATLLTQNRQAILSRLGFATPHQLLARNLPPEPTGITPT